MFTETTTQTTGNALETEEHTKITVDALGRAVIEGMNYTGNACSILGDKLSRALGGGNKTDKPEAFASDHETEQQGQHW